MNPGSPWPPLLLTLVMLASCFVPASVGNRAAKQGLTLLENVGSRSDPPTNFVTNGVVIGVAGGSVSSYVPSLVSDKTMQDLQQAAQAWDAASSGKTRVGLECSLRK
ncbi:MAG: hypothetical protein Q4C67_08010 [Deinococcus sp.]|nr:hypothetical protein [Deinococcus sp.]